MGSSVGLLADELRGSVPVRGAPRDRSGSTSPTGVCWSVSPADKCQDGEIRGKFLVGGSRGSVCTSDCRCDGALFSEPRDRGSASKLRDSHWSVSPASIPVRHVQCPVQGRRAERCWVPGPLPGRRPSVPPSVFGGPHIGHCRPSGLCLLFCRVLLCGDAVWHPLKEG